jgi:K+-transporting ATPase ATPase B chain
MPTTISALISTISLSGMEKLFNRNIIALNNRALEIAGDIDLVLFDKTGTVTLGNRMASEFIPIADKSFEKLIFASEICSIYDETIEGISIINLIKEKFTLKIKPDEYKYIDFTPFSAESTTSSAVYKNNIYFKGSIQSILTILNSKGISYPKKINSIAQQIGEEGATPIAILQNDEVLGIIKLKDTIKPGLKERLKRLYIMGVKTLMITGDNYYTSKTIAKEAGIENFKSDSTPEEKINFIKEQQAKGTIIAMIGDGVNDAFPMSCADISLAMNSGAQETKEASNLIDLDNDPAKIIEVIEVGRQVNMTKGCINTFSLFNDLAKYFAILPAIFSPLFPELSRINIMSLYSPYTAILSAVIFNSVVILLMIPIAIKGVKYRAMSATKTARKFLIFFGITGLFAPFIGIKLIDLFIQLIISFFLL